MNLSLPPTHAATTDLNVLRQAAEQGDVQAQLALAIRHRDGKGSEYNPVEAMRWAYLAADAGHAEAMDFVGFAYLRGTMIPRSSALAFGYFRAAAPKSAQAAFNLGQCYYGAQGAEQDCAKALEWWEKGRRSGPRPRRRRRGDGPSLRRGRTPRCRQGASPGRTRGRTRQCLRPRGARRAALPGRRCRDRPRALDPRRPTASHRRNRSSRPAIRPGLRPAGRRSAQAAALPAAGGRAGEVRLRAHAAHSSGLQQLRRQRLRRLRALPRQRDQRLGLQEALPSPLGTGTDWWHLLDASKKIRQRWKLVRFTPDEAGFEQATALLRSELDAGLPVVVDFKYVGPQYAGGFAGHTLNVCGYLAEEDLYILCNPAVATPGLQLITATDLKDFWRSDHYGAQAGGVLARPAFVIDRT